MDSLISLTIYCVLLVNVRKIVELKNFYIKQQYRNSNKVSYPSYYSANVTLNLVIAATSVIST